MEQQPFDIWAVSPNPSTEERAELQKRHGFWRLGTILVVRKFLEDHCLHLKPVPQTEFDERAEGLTLDELRAEGTQYFQEVDRLAAIEGRKILHALRITGRQDPLFIDPKEDTVRFWALQNPHDNAWLYKEEWVNDPKTGKLRIISKQALDNPVITARQNANRS